MFFIKQAQSAATTEAGRSDGGQDIKAFLMAGRE